MAILEVNARVKYNVEISDEDYESYMDGDLDEDVLVDYYYDYLIVDNEVDFEVIDSTVYDSI